MKPLEMLRCYASTTKTLKHIFYDDQKIEKGFYKNEAGKNGNKEEK